MRGERGGDTGGRGGRTGSPVRPGVGPWRFADRDLGPGMPSLGPGPTRTGSLVPRPAGGGQGHVRVRHAGPPPPWGCCDAWPGGLLYRPRGMGHAGDRLSGAGRCGARGLTRRSGGYMEGRPPHRSLPWGRRDCSAKGAAIRGRAAMGALSLGALSLGAVSVGARPWGQPDRRSSLPGGALWASRAVGDACAHLSGSPWAGVEDRGSGGSDGQGHRRGLVLRPGGWETGSPAVEGIPGLWPRWLERPAGGGQGGSYARPVTDRVARMPGRPWTGWLVGPAGRGQGRLDVWPVGLGRGGGACGVGVPARGPLVQRVGARTERKGGQRARRLGSGVGCVPGGITV